MNRRLRLSAGLHRPQIWLLLPALGLCAWLLHEPGASSSPQISPPGDQSPRPLAATSSPNEPETSAPIVLCDVHSDQASDSGVDAALLALFEKSPSSALHAVEQLSEPARSDLHLALCSRLGRFPAQALAELGKLRNQQSPNGDDLSSVIESSLIREGALAEAQQAVQMAPAGKGPEWLAQVCTAWTLHDVSQAPRLESLLLANTTEDAALRAFYQAWARSDPASLLTHASGQPEGPARTTARRAGLEAWLSTAPCEATLEALRSANSDTDFDHALRDFIVRGDSLARPSSQALSLAVEIHDPALREESLTQALAERAAENPAAARCFVLQLPDTDAALRTRLLASLEPAPEFPQQ